MALCFLASYWPDGEGWSVAEAAPLGGLIVDGRHCHSSLLLPVCCLSPSLSAGFLDFTAGVGDGRVLSCPEFEQMKISLVSLEVGPETGTLSGPQLMGEWEALLNWGQKGQMLV